MMILCFLFALLVVQGCEDNSYRDRAQFQQMELMLDAISVESDPRWEARLDAAEKIVIDNTEIRQVHQMCVSAYREYANAMGEMATARQGIETLEKTISSGQIAQVASEYAHAKEAIMQTSAHLETSQKLIQKCTLLRRDIRGRLKLTRN
ncbi:MAG: hypothetical protein JXX14_01480 [Deltaproteobacteria bacterium]|nr:hypothetical protein [Deltaproteobacteria bacterium]